MDVFFFLTLFYGMLVAKDSVGRELKNYFFMDKKSKIFFIVFFLLIAGSVAVSYYRFIVARDYIIQAEAQCDPYTEACFTYVCDPTAGEECTGDPVEDTSYYKLIYRNAKNIPLCDPNDENCAALTCPEGEAECSFTLCDPATAEADSVVCNDPVAYTLENPIEEESAEGDVEEGDAMEEGTDAESTDSTDIVAPEESETPAQPTTAIPAVIQN
ncbi:MAG: hypothetical protein WAW00_01225 [Candidatus Moraniibacteriota bacterium]